MSLSRNGFRGKQGGLETEAPLMNQTSSSVTRGVKIRANFGASAFGPASSLTMEVERRYADGLFPAILHLRARSFALILRPLQVMH